MFKFIIYKQLFTLFYNHYYIEVCYYLLLISIYLHYFINKLS